MISPERVFKKSVKVSFVFKKKSEELRVHKGSKPTDQKRIV